MSRQTRDQNAYSTIRPVRAKRNGTELTSSEASYARGDAIYREGDPAVDLYRVVNGVVRTCKHLLDGRRQVGAFYLPGDTFGLEPGAEHIFRSEAVVQTQVLIIKRTDLISFQLSDLMHHELQRAQSHLLLLIKTAPERLASFLLEIGERLQSSEEVELPMSRRDIAEYLGLTVETVSRTFTQLEAEMTIALPTSRRIALCNRVALERLAEGIPSPGIISLSLKPGGKRSLRSLRASA
jgi:CRP/FNR family transcriptional regulator, nitrogen fixation regulation protein